MAIFRAIVSVLRLSLKWFDYPRFSETLIHNKYSHKHIKYWTNNGKMCTFHMIRFQLNVTIQTLLVASRMAHHRFMLFKIYIWPEPSMHVFNMIGKHRFSWEYVRIEHVRCCVQTRCIQCQRHAPHIIQQRTHLMDFTFMNRICERFVRSEQQQRISHDWCIVNLNVLSMNLLIINVMLQWKIDVEKVRWW